MNKNLSIRNKMIVSIIIGCLLPFFVGISYTKDSAEEWLYNNNVENTKRVLNQTAQQVDESVLQNMLKLTSALAADDRIINVSDDITSYVDITKVKNQKSKEEEAIANIFRTIAENYEMVSFISYGTELGGYVEYPEFNPTSSYDPRTRGWYNNAVSNSDLLISEPYRTQVSKELVISVDKAVMNEGKVVGVISLTITLDNIMKKISSIHYGKTGYVNILSPNNVFINSPQNKHWHMKTVEQVNLDVFKNVDKYNGKSFEGKINDVEKVFTVYISPYSGWKYISIIDKSEVLSESRFLSAMLNGTLIFTALTIIVLILLISNHITRPIVNLSNIIKKMSNFQYSPNDHKDFKEYTEKKDEIGEIARALNLLEDNFIELRSKMKVIEEEIDCINIDDKNIHQLSLSANSPFVSVTKSINTLLFKVHDYVDQIKDYNKEISLKNSLLLQSEQDLISRFEQINIQKEQINFLAEHDPLTNLPNRRIFNERLKNELESGATGAVMMMDMDNFKSINDTLGHIFGDRVLQYISNKLESTITDNIFVSRFGGDEFIILFRCEESEKNLSEYINGIFELFDETVIIQDNEINIQFSMGVSVFPNDSSNLDEIIMNADLALYKVKGTGRNDYAYFNSEMATELKSKLDIKKMLSYALENDGFKMVYQPQINLKSGNIYGYEALLRLKDYDISPMKFISVAEENGLIIPIGRTVTKLVIEQIKRWNNMGLETKPVSINFSGLQIKDLGYKEYLLDLLEKNNVDPGNIVIEITEHIFLENKDATIEFIEELRANGVKIAIDDFGMGYSSLSYLASLPVDYLKFDRELNYSFLQYEDKRVMENLIAFVHSLKLYIIAEGIEEHNHVKKLYEANCDCVQGFYFSKPLEVEEVEKGYYRTY